MAFVNAYGRSNPLASFGEGVSTVAGLQQDAAKRQAGSALSRGDYTGAANPLFETGQLDAGVRVQEMGRKRQQDAASSMAASEKAVLDYTDQLIGNVGNVWKQYGAQDQSPDKAMARQRVLQAFDMGAGRLRELGETPDEIQEIRSSFEQDPEFTLAALGKAIEQKKLEIRNVGDEVLAIDPYTGQPVNRMRGARTVNIPEGGALYDIPGTGGMETPAAPTMATPPAQAPRQPQGLAGGADLSMVDGLLEQTGGQVTSRTRTAERNAQVGGVGDSYHLTGQARDAIPPRGMNTAQYAATLKQNLPGWDVIDEGDHVHIEPGPAMGARKTPQGPYRVASMGETPRGNTTVSAAPQPPQETNGSPRLLVQRPKAPKEQVRTLSPAEVAAAGFLPGTIVQQKPDGSFDTVQSPNNQASPRKAEADLRKEFNARPEVKEFRDVSNSYNTIKGLFSKAPSAASDIAGIFSYMKMLDPGSVVREGEFATAQNAAGIPDQVRNLYNKSLNGQRLNPKQRDDFLAQAQSIFNTRSTRFGELSNEYRSYASDYGVDPDRVVSTPQPAAATAPAGGAPKAAQRGKDGRFYIADPNKPGSFPEVRKAPDGNWYFRSGSDFYRVRD